MGANREQVRLVSDQVVERVLCAEASGHLQRDVATNHVLLNVRHEYVTIR